MYTKIYQTLNLVYHSPLASVRLNEEGHQFQLYLYSSRHAYGPRGSQVAHEGTWHFYYKNALEEAYFLPIYGGGEGRERDRSEGVKNELQCQEFLLSDLQLQPLYNNPNPNPNLKTLLLIL